MSFEPYWDGEYEDEEGHTRFRIPPRRLAELVPTDEIVEEPEEEEERES